MVTQEYMHTVVAHSIIRVGGCLLGAHTWQAMNIYYTDQVSHLSGMPSLYDIVYGVSHLSPLPPLKVVIVSF